jgi:hypothetical protein
MTVVTDCECGLPLDEHASGLVLLHHDQEMRKASIERLRGNLSRLMVGEGMLRILVEAALTDEEVGR